MSDGFVNLHCHFDFSPLDGAMKVDGGFAYAAQMGQLALAITDHGSMSGHYEAWLAGKKHDVKPILGIEAYVAPDSLHNNSPFFFGSEDQRKLDVGGKGKATHMTMLALNVTGLRNLYKMQYIAATEGFYGYPRIDLALMAQYSKGILVTSGCAGSAISIYLRLGQRDNAIAYAKRLLEIYGENFFIEVMDHGIEEDDLNDHDLNRMLIDVATELNIPLVATNDAHYCTADKADAHDAFLCLQTHSNLADEKRFRFNGSGYHLKSAAEMKATLRDVPEEAIANTLVIANRVESYDSHFEFKNRMPHLPGIAPEDEDEALAEMCFRELEIRFGAHERYPEYLARLSRELDVMRKTGFSGYHLVLGDILSWAKSQGIRIGPCRGSAGGSLVCFLMNISGVDPILHNLPFERYLNLDRVSMPDIDVDIEITRRKEVVEYTRQRFGHKNVVKILTLGTIKAKAAIKDAGGLLGFDFPTRNRLTNMFPKPIHGFSPNLSCVFDKTDERYKDARELRAEIETNPDSRAIYDLAIKLEGLIRNFGVHAAGVIISSEPLDEVIPLRLPTGKDKEEDADLVTGFDAPAMEPMGLIKYDYLGLENLTTINKALDFIEELYGKRVVLEDLALDDSPTYKMLAAGNSFGVFQLDSDGMQRLLKRMRPDRFEDICAVLALYRPGPMGMDAHNLYADRKTGKEKVVPIHEEFKDTLKDILDPTYGVFCFQETVMAALVEVADYTPGQADAIRRIMGKKKPAEMAKLEPELREKMLAKGYSEEAFSALWEILVPFSAYSFNQAHTVGYGLIAYWTAWLKCHYPVAYFAALLSAEADDQEKLTTYLQNARDNGVAILPPDINESDFGFTPTKEGIRFGLSAIKGVGESVISEYREGFVGSLNDFYCNIPDKVNSRSLQCLIQAGALDEFGNRVEHSEKSTQWLERAKDTKKAISHGDRPILLGGYYLGLSQTGKQQMREWEISLLGAELTPREITVSLERPLTEEEWIWINKTLATHPGNQSVKFTLGSIIFSSGHRVHPSDTLAQVLNALEPVSADLG